MATDRNQGGTQQGGGDQDKPQPKPPVIIPKPMIQGSETKDDKNRGTERRVSKP